MSLSNHPACETLREVLSLQGTDVHVAQLPKDNFGCLSSDDGTEGDVERAVAEEVAKDQRSNAALSDALAVLGVFPTGLERGYCVIPRQPEVSGEGLLTKRRVVKVVMEEAQVGSCVLAVWDARKKRARNGAPNTPPLKSEDQNLMYWPATIKQFTGAFAGLSDAPDDLLMAFADFETMADFSSTVPFLLCVDLIFSDESEEKRQRLDWSVSHEVPFHEVDATPPRRGGTHATAGSPTTCRRDGACQLLSHLLPQVVSVRNYSIVERAEAGHDTKTVQKRHRPAATPVEHPMVSAPISARDIVYKRAYKSRHFTLLTVSDAAVKAEAKRQALRDLQQRWMRAKAARPTVQRAGSLEEASSQSHGALSRPTAIGEGTVVPRRRGANVAATPLEQPSLPNLGRPASAVEPRTLSHLSQQTPQTRSSFLDLDGIETPSSSRRHHQHPTTGGASLQAASASASPEPATNSTNVSPPRGARLPNRPQRQVAEGLAIPRLQGAASVKVLTSSAPTHVTDVQPSRRALPEQPPPPTAVPTNGWPEPRPPSALVAHAAEEMEADDSDALVEREVERLEEELAVLRHRMHSSKAAPMRPSHDRHASPPLKHPLEDIDKSSPIPLPRSNVPVPLEAPAEAHHRPSSATKVKMDASGGSPLHTSRGNASVKLWKRAPSTTFPPNSYVFVDPNARSISPLLGTVPLRDDAQRRRDGGPTGSAGRPRNAQLSPKRSTTGVSGGAPAGHSTPNHRRPAQSPSTLSRPRTAIGMDAHYHRSVAYKEVVRRAVEDSKKHGLDWVRKQQVHHTQLFRRDTKELDNSPLLQRKRRVIEKAEHDGSRSPGSRGTSRTPSVASHGQLSPIRTGSPTQPDVFSRLSTIASSRRVGGDGQRGPSPRGVSPRAQQAMFAPPPPMESTSRRTGSGGGGIIAAVSSTPAAGNNEYHVRRSISPDFDVSAPLEPTPHLHTSRSQSQHSIARRSFAMPTLASMAVQS